MRVFSSIILLSQLQSAAALDDIVTAAQILKVQANVEAVTTAAKATESGGTWEAVKTAFTSAGDAPMSLQDMAQATWTEAGWAKTAGDFYAGTDADKMTTDAFANAVLDGTDQFGVASYNSGRVEAIKKASHDEIQVTFVQGMMARAVTKEAAAAGSGTVDWEAAAALYFGVLLADVDAARLATTSGYMPSTVANKRCANFGTCPKDAAGEKTASPQNTAIKAAFDGGASAANLKIISDQIALTYSYASLRYLSKLDNDLDECSTADTGVEDHHYEGLAFFRVLRPQLAAADASGAAAIQAIYSEKRDDQATMSWGGTFYCPSKVTLTTFMAGKGVTMGTFENDVDAAKCAAAGEVECCVRAGCAGGTQAAAALAATAAATTVDDSSSASCVPTLAGSALAIAGVFSCML